MKIEKTVEIDAPVEQVWALVNDVPRVAQCMPGAALTNVVDERTYEGTVAVKLGPLRMNYKGTAVIDERDDATHTARLNASGRDVKGAGTARAAVTSRLEPVGSDRTRLVVSSDLQLTGKVASFGRGGAINDVATRLLNEFADCLRSTLEAEQAPSAAPAAATGAGDAAAADAVAAGAAAADAGSGQAAAAAAPAAAAGAPAATPRAPTALPRASEPRPLSAGSIIGTVIAGRLKALWRRLLRLLGVGRRGRR